MVAAALRGGAVARYAFEPVPVFLSSRRIGEGRAGAHGKLEFSSPDAVARGDEGCGVTDRCSCAGAAHRRNWSLGFGGLRRARGGGVLVAGFRVARLGGSHRHGPGSVAAPPVL